MEEIKVNVGEKVKNVINEALNVCNVFIGYEYSLELEDILVSIVSFISNVCDLETKEKEEAISLVKELYSINKYSEYLLFKKNKTENSNDILYVGNKYFNILEKRENKTWIFDAKEFKEEINRNALEGNIFALNIKAYMVYLGLVFESDTKFATYLFKMSLYAGNHFAAKVLSKIDIENSYYYINLFNCLNDKLLYLDYRTNDYDKKITEDAKLILSSYMLIRERGKANLDNIQYLISSKDSSDIKENNLKNDYLYRGKRTKIGF